MGKFMQADKKNRLVVIGLDSADFYLIRKWMDEGHLPTLTSLAQRGIMQRLDSTADVGSDTVWPSFFTGTSPAKHNGFFSRRLKCGTYRLIFEPEATIVKREPFWMPLGRAGKRIILLDIPKTYPRRDLNAIQLVGWGNHAPGWHADSWPAEILKEVRDRFGNYPVQDCDRFVPSGFRELSRFYQTLLSGIQKKASVSRHFLTQEDWDLLITVFGEPHCAGHNFWHLMDSHHPRYDRKSSETLGNVILNVYASVDAAIGNLMETHPDATYVILSTEGMGPNYTGSFLLPEILRRLGVASNKGMLRRWAPSRLWGPHAIRNLRSLLPTPVRRAVESFKHIVPHKSWGSWKTRLMNASEDWRQSRAFCVPSDFNGAIRVNLKGREPCGLVEPGPEYDALCGELTEALSQLVNADTGRAAVSEVVRVDSIHQGEHLRNFPDVIVKWKGDAPICRLSSPRIGTVVGTNQHERSGSHRPYGFIIAAGKPIARGKQSERGTIMDLAPTLLHLMGQDAPQDMDGQVLHHLLTEEDSKDAQ